ncbi:MAG: LysR family transcriptional regulator [Pseudomonadota bacterium]
MEFRHLKTLIAIAEERHFGRAAARLNTSQPVVSRTLRDMEVRLGVKLVERSARSVELTRAGEEFLASAQQSVRHFDTAIRAAKSGTGKGLTHLSLGIMIGAAHPIVGHIVSGFRDRNPSAAVKVISSTERSLGTDLAEGRIDAAVFFEPSIPAGLKRCSIAEIPLEVLLPVHHPLTGLDAVSFEDVVGLPLILPGSDGHPVLYERVRNMFHAKRVNFAISVEEISQTLALVAGGAAIGIAPITQGLVYPGVERRPLVPAMSTRLELAWSHSSPVIEDLLGNISELTKLC